MQAEPGGRPRDHGTVCTAHARHMDMDMDMDMAHGTWHMHMHMHMLVHACAIHGTCTARAQHTHITRIASPQALASAAELLENNAFDSYEAHVALRTVRAVALLTPA